MKAIQKFLQLTRQDKVLFLEAASETLLVRIATTIWNTAKYTSRLRWSRREATTIITPVMQQQIIQVKVAILQSRHLLWSRKCLVESIAAKKMLDRRHIPSTMYLGVAKNEKGKLIAHSWVKSGDTWVSGRKDCHKFAIVGFFS